MQARGLADSLNSFGCNLYTIYVVIMSTTAGKIKILEQQLLKYERIAVAFSGGIDSTFLLYFVVKTLGGENASAYSCISDVNSDKGVSTMRNVYNKHFAEKIFLREVPLYPLRWKEFVSNSDKRCYYCKKRMYSTLLEEVHKDSFYILADGTNVDDLKGGRPGLRAIRELQIHTPLVDAGLTKQEIRKVAKELGLINHDLASNSCLATRIKEGTMITLDGLKLVEKAEAYLHKLGFEGCRVKIDGANALIEVQRGDFERFAQDEIRSGVVHTFNHLGLKVVSLSLRGR